MTVVSCLPSPAARREKRSLSSKGSSGRPLGRRRGRGRRAGGFTLPELLIAVGIIAVLLSILVPTIAAARNRAKAVLCVSNVRQLCLGMTAYAAAWGRQYPPNTTTPAPADSWYDSGRVAECLAPQGVSLAPTTGGVFVCPCDEDAGRSYAMNYWASSKVDSPPSVATGEFFRADVADASKTILVAECWSSLRPTLAAGWVAPATLGAEGTPGQRFGGAAGGDRLSFSTRGTGGGVVKSPSELPFVRHRGLSGSANPGDAKGSVSIGYVDGHAELKADTDLVLPTGLSSLNSLWSPADARANN